MSSLGNIFNFEAFNFKDMLKKVKDDPERLLFGAVDPWSTKLWNKILDKDYEPIVDQMGGAYGGHTVSAFGNKDGGVYKRAADAGIDTRAGGAMHDLSHVVAATYAGNYGMGQAGFGGGGQAGGEQPGWQRFMRMGQQQPQGQAQDQPMDMKAKIIKELIEAEKRKALNMPPPEFDMFSAGRY